MLTRGLLALCAIVGAVAFAPCAAEAQPVRGTCTSCGTDAVNCGRCIGNGTACFDTLAAAERRPGVFQTPDGRDARRLSFARLIKGASTSSSDINRAVSRSYNGGNIWLYYGTGTPAGYCAPPGGPPRAFATAPTLTTLQLFFAELSLSLYLVFSSLSLSFLVELSSL